MIIDLKAYNAYDPWHGNDENRFQHAVAASNRTLRFVTVPLGKTERN